MTGSIGSTINVYYPIVFEDVAVAVGSIANGTVNVTTVNLNACTISNYGASSVGIYTLIFILN